HRPHEHAKPDATRTLQAGADQYDERDPGVVESEGKGHGAGRLNIATVRWYTVYLHCYANRRTAQAGSGPCRRGQGELEPGRSGGYPAVPVPALALRVRHGQVRQMRMPSVGRRREPAATELEGEEAAGRAPRRGLPAALPALDPARHRAAS